MSGKCTVRDLGHVITRPVPGISGKLTITCKVHGVIAECAFDSLTLEHARNYGIKKAMAHLEEQNRPPTQEEIFEQTIQFFV